MASQYDVAARLAEGEPAVEHTQSYVQACRALGYQQPDLTARPSQVAEWYGTEAGLDLRVLDGDVAELRGAVTEIEEALWAQRSQVTELAAAWAGPGAESATRFLQRHCDTAAEIAAQVRTAAEHCAALRDELWRAVDGKVAATVAVDDRHIADRSTWLAAAQAVSTGSDKAELVVRQQVMPYVDHDIRNDWLAAMSAADATVAASYDTAIHALASIRDVSFDLPGDLGPRWHPASTDDSVTPLTPAASSTSGPPPVVPAAAPAPPPPPEPLPDPAPPADEPEAAASTLPDDAAGLSSGASGLGGLGGMTGGLGGVIGSIVDSIGGLLGSLGGGLGGDQGLGDDPSGLDDDDDSAADDADEPDETSEPTAAHVEADAAVPDPPVIGESPPAPAEVAAEPAAQQTGPPPPDPPAPDASPAAEQPPPGATATPDGATPCEIAEDQLPQVGQ